MERELLERYINEGLSTRKIAACENVSQITIRYWLTKHELSTRKTREFRCVCGETDPEKFVNMGDGRKHFSKCKACHSKYTIERFRSYKQQAVDYKGGCCSKCGYNKCLRSMHFHHRDSNEKDPNWTQMRNWMFDKVKTELDKCDLLCANCHGEVHEELDLGDVA